MKKVTQNSTGVFPVKSEPPLSKVYDLDVVDESDEQALGDPTNNLADALKDIMTPDNSWTLDISPKLPGYEYPEINMEGFDEVEEQAEKEARLTDLQIKVFEKQLASTEKDRPPQDKTVYKIVFTPNQVILLNGIRISQPNFDGENSNIFEFLYKHPNKTHKLSDIEKAIGREIVQPLNKVVEKLGFSGARRMAFFKVSKTSIHFRNPVDKNLLAELGITGHL